jgi:hypothetical protein
MRFSAGLENAGLKPTPEKSTDVCWTEVLTEAGTSRQTYSSANITSWGNCIIGVQ